MLANEDIDAYGSLLDSTRGIIFLGTPHRGSEFVSSMLMFTNLINLVSFGKVIRKTLLRSLETNSQMLAEISRQFVHRSTGLKIMTFIEQQIERPLSTPVRVISCVTVYLSDII